MQTNTNFSISEALKFGWETFKKRPFFWIVVGLISGVGSGSNSISSDDSSSTSGEAFFSQFEPSVLFIVIGVIVISVLVLTFVLLALEMGAYKAALEAVEGKVSKWGILVSEFNYQRVFKYFLIYIWYGLIVLLGLLLLVVPGIIWAIKYQFAMYFYVEKNTSLSESFRLSAVATEGVKWKLFGFALVSAALMIAGALAFVVGLLVAMPVVLLASFYIYKKLSEQSVEPTVPGAPVKPTIETPAYQADVVRN